MARPLYYSEFAVAAWKQFVHEGRCDESPNYYRMYARQQDNKAIRGYRGRYACCEECELCTCWCNSGYIWDPDGHSELQDASFNSIDPDTYANINVSVGGLEICEGPPWQMGNEECHIWCYNHWDAVNMDGNYSLEWVGFAGEWCVWEYQGDWFLIDGCPVYITVQAKINRTNGNWAVGLDLIMDVGDEDCPLCFGGTAPGGFIGSVSGVDRPYCSEGTTGPIDNWCVGSHDDCCDPLTMPIYGGQATISWGTVDLATPDYYIAKFTGDIVPCEGCNMKTTVEAAIKALKNPAGFVLPLRRFCAWANPYMPVPDTQPVSATGTITFTGQPEDANTVTLDDTFNPAVTFEFDDDSSVTEGNIAVIIGANKEATIATLIGAINSSSLGITAKASDPPDNICTLYNTLVHAAGNEDIVKVGANITVDGMSDGVAFATHHGWFWHVGLSMHDADGDTRWTIIASIIDYRHKRNVPGISGLKYNCPQDRHRHCFYWADATVAVESQNCNNAPGLANDPVEMDCENEHEESGSGPYSYSPCAEGGTVELTGVT